MRSGPGHPLGYPVGTTIGVVAVCAAMTPFADVDQLAGLAVVVVVVLGYTAFRLATAFGRLPNGLETPGAVTIRRVRNQHRLVSRSWLEITGNAASGSRESTESRWLPVYFDPALLALTETTAEVTARTLRADAVRLYPSGRIRTGEPPGRLIDNASLPDPEAAEKGAKVTTPTRRLLLDAQSAVAAPFAALLWVYVMGGGLPAFVGATLVGAAVTVWLAAVRGSDPS
ncbi:hypothetical protein [Nocardia sp. NBC_01377]|uniref:hypothetical protein n=1 Tax=Nocardia sp. NBC_01377 TaxID=2903595 RepID=UPI003865B2C9